MIAYVVAGVATAAGLAVAIWQQRRVKTLKNDFKKLRGDFTQANERAASARAEKAQVMRIANQHLAGPLREAHDRITSLATTSGLSAEDAAAVNGLRENMQQLQQGLGALEQFQALENRSRAVTVLSLNVGAVLHEAVLKVQSHAQTKGVRLSLPDPSKTCLALADADLLRKAIESLLVDAIEVTPRESTVALSLYQTSDRVLITVSDEGPGSPVAEQAALLDHSGNSRPPFHQQDARLNLAMVHNLIKAMDGWLWSQGEPGRGTTHVIELSLAPVKAAPKVAQPR